MRDIALVLAMLGYLPLALYSPAAGAICWIWLSIMSPHELVYSFAYGKPFNSVLAGATILGWLVSKERKHWTPDALPWLLLAFAVWMTFNSVFAPFPDWSWQYWDRTMRVLVLIFLVFVLATTKARIHGFIWAIVIALGFYGVKGGIFTIVTGGRHIVYGPQSTVLGDNNQLAAAMVMALPLVNYLRMHSRGKLMQAGLTAALGLLVMMVLGSKSRGGVVALAASLFVFWLTVRRKAFYAIGATAVIGLGLFLMPDSFWQRMSTLEHADTDASFGGRLNAWGVAFRVAVDRFPFGAGFYGPQLPTIWDSYSPETSSHAAHSIYFQVLGEHGFMGLALYLMILFLGVWNLQIVMHQTRSDPELLWAFDLAKMMRVALIGFYVGGAALSMAYFDGLLVLIALSSCLRELASRQTAPAAVAAKPILGRPGSAAANAVPARPTAVPWRERAARPTGRRS